MKRAFDNVFSLLGLCVLSPLFLLIAAMVKFQDGGPVLFVQERIGWKGRPFRMFKFRTMIVNAGGRDLTVGEDSRITAIGRVLRKFKLDEFPQLWNVLRGEMSFVGPRPEIVKYVSLYTEAQRKVLGLRPGITDPASFAFFDESELLGRAADPERFYREQLMAEKIRINLEYAARANYGTDILLIVATVARAAGLKLDIFGWLRIEMPKLKT
jgi:lipopolysaccharide/colanic/teichoic acid biosynthesis glycosyltransferase